MADDFEAGPGLTAAITITETVGCDFSTALTEVYTDTNGNGPNT